MPAEALDEPLQGSPPDSKHACDKNWHDEQHNAKGPVLPPRLET